MAEKTPLARMFGDLYPYKDRFEAYMRIPDRGRAPEDIYHELQTIAEEEDKCWETGLLSGTMYHGGREHYAFLNRIFSLFSYVNLIQRDICPSGTKFESEIVAMVAHLLHAESVKEHNPDDEVCGTVTSGGTESIFNSVFIHREWGREEKGITEPEMVVPVTIHPAFHKAAHYLGVRVIAVPVDHQFEVDLEAVRSHITPNTIALVGSAGNYPYGVIDPLGKLSDLALEYKIGFHVDGCLGGFILPWIERLGYDIPTFDFRLPGITAISCDTHKYGYALKGTSTLLVRNRKLLRYQFYSITDWPGGLYASPTMQGSRSGGLSAATWAAMVTMGEDGYLKAARLIMDTADKIRHGIAEIPEIKIAGKSTFLVSLISDQVNMYHVNDYLISKGWRMNVCQNPPGFHFCVTLSNTLPGVADKLIQDLRDGVAYAKEPPQPFPKSGAIYGLSGNLEGQAFIKEGMLEFIEATYGEV
jgi:glutamate/tyrosine decarboxylase-like PLP-dependent enzyme